MRDDPLQPNDPQGRPLAGRPDDLGPVRPAEPRSWINRAGDEIAAWFGDVHAASRRQRDKAIGDHTGQGPMAYVDTDERIVQELNQRLTFDPTLNASRVQVSALAGAVTLAGQVTTTAESRRAEDLAMAVPGVNAVHNRLMVA